MAVIPANTLSDTGYTLTLSAARRPWPGQWGQTLIVRFRVHRPPAAPLPVTATTTAPPRPGLADVSVAVDLRPWGALPEAVLPLRFRWVYVLESGAAEWPLRLADGGGFAEGLAEWRGPVPWVWTPPGAAAAEVRVGVHVEDGHGARAGPFFAEQRLHVLRGPCTAACGGVCVAGHGGRLASVHQFNHNAHVHLWPVQMRMRLRVRVRDQKCSVFSRYDVHTDGRGTVPPTPFWCAHPTGGGRGGGSVRVFFRKMGPHRAITLQFTSLNIEVCKP